MNKQIAVILGSIGLVVVALSVSMVLFFGQSAPAIVVEDEFSIPETSISQKEENSTPYSVPPIKVERKQVVEEPAASEAKETVPPPETTETTEPDGGTVQTPNWEAQKELPPDTDLTNPDSQPEYVTPPASSSKAAPASSAAPNTSSKSSGGTPKNGDTKVVDGYTYTYVMGFGWVKDGNGGTTEYIPGELSGEKVGH